MKKLLWIIGVYIKYIYLTIVYYLEELDYIVFGKIDELKYKVKRFIRNKTQYLEESIAKVFKLLTAGEALLVQLIVLLIVLLAIMGISLQNKIEYIESIESTLNDNSESYSELYQELHATYSEINSLVELNSDLKESVEEYKDKLKESRKSASQLEKETIRELMFMSAEAYEIDPYLLIAISRHETGNWTSSLCLNYNNFGGLRGSDWYHYDSAVEGINAMCKVLKWYKNNGMGTIQSMAYTYCPDGTLEWISTVTKFYNEEKK